LDVLGALRVDVIARTDDLEAAPDDFVRDGVAVGPFRVDVPGSGDGFAGRSFDYVAALLGFGVRLLSLTVLGDATNAIRDEVVLHSEGPSLGANDRQHAPRVTRSHEGTMRKLLGVLLIAFAVACNDSTGPGNGSVAGDYLLTSANGIAVPAVASQDATGTYEVLHGRIVLRSDFSFVDSLSDRFTPVGQAPQPRIDVREGTWVQLGNNITLNIVTSNGLESYSVTWIDANTLAYSEPELSLIYRR
jgi:hypothetical protein